MLAGRRRGHGRRAAWAGRRQARPGRVSSGAETAAPTTRPACLGWTAAVAPRRGWAPFCAALCGPTPVAARQCRRPTPRRASSWPRSSVLAARRPCGAQSQTNPAASRCVRVFFSFYIAASCSVPRPIPGRGGGAGIGEGSSWRVPGRLHADAQDGFGELRRPPWGRWAVGLVGGRHAADSKLFLRRANRCEDQRRDEARGPVAECV